MFKSTTTGVPQRLRYAAMALFAITSWTGCAALRPIEGMPVDHVPTEWKGRSRDGMQTIDLSLLRRERPTVHVVDSGDVLAIHIAGVFIPPDKEDLPPVMLPRENELKPSTGFPVPVRDDGTISIPIAGSIHVRGMTVRQVEDMLRRKFVEELQVLKEGKDRIIVNLLSPRKYRVLVIRQETASGGGGGGGSVGGGGAGGGGGSTGGGGAASGSVSIGASKRGTGTVVSLPAYENDVLHALAQTAGLPGLDAENAIYVIRGTRGCSRLMNNSYNQQQGYHNMSHPAPEYQMPVIQAPATDVMMGPGVQIRGQSPDKVEHANFNGGLSNRIRQVAGWDLIKGRFASPKVQPTIGHSTQTPYQLTSETLPIPSYNNTVGNEVYVPTMTQHSIGNITGQDKTTGAADTDPKPANAPSSVESDSNGTVMEAPIASGEYQGFDETNTYNGPVGIEGFGMFNQGYTIQSSGTKRIPVRLYPGDVPQFTCDDVTLKDGDIIFIESRDSEVYYTGGLLGGGQFTLPRDYDIDIIEAISLATSPQQSQQQGRNVGGISALNQDVSISASEAIILRKLPHGQQARIKVDLYRAVRYPTERILIQPGDFILLQFTRTERFFAFFERHLLEGALLGVATSQFQAN